MSGDDLISIPCAGCGRGDAGAMTLRVADGRHAWFCDGCAPDLQQPMSLDDVRAGLEEVYGAGSMTAPAAPKRRPRPPKPLARRGFVSGLKAPADGSPRHEVHEHERLTAVERAAYEQGRADERASLDAAALVHEPCLFAVVDKLRELAGEPELLIDATELRNRPVNNLTVMPLLNAAADWLAQHVDTAAGGVS